MVPCLLELRGLVKADPEHGEEKRLRIKWEEWIGVIGWMRRLGCAATSRFCYSSWCPPPRVESIHIREKGACAREVTLVIPK